MREKLSGIPWTRETVNELILWRGNYSGDHQDPLDQEKNVIHGDHSDQYQYCIKFFQILWYWNKKTNILNNLKNFYCDIANFVYPTPRIALFFREGKKPPEWAKNYD